MPGQVPAQIAIDQTVTLALDAIRTAFLSGKPLWLGVGTGNSIPGSASQLDSELTTAALEQGTYARAAVPLFRCALLTTYSENDTTRIEATWYNPAGAGFGYAAPASCAVAISEYAFFDAPTGGNMLYRAVIPPIDVGWGGGINCTTRYIAGILSYEATVLASAPIAYYKLNETVGPTASDSSGNKRNMSIGAGVTLGVPGLITTSADTAMLLPGVAAAVDVIISAARIEALEPASALSVECWINPAAISEGFEQVIVCYGDDATWAPWNLMLRPSGNLVWTLYVAGGATLTSTATLVVGQKYHIIATYDGAFLRLYMNGVLDNSIAALGTIGNYSYSDGANTYGLTIGEDGVYGDSAFNGTIAHVAIYDKALTASDVLAHYAAA